MKRRTFLIRGALGGAAVSLLGGTYLALRRSPSVHRPTETLYALNETAFGVIAAMAAQLVTNAGRDPVEIAHGVDVALSFQPAENVRDLNRALAAFETGLFGLFTRGSFRTFTELPTDAQRDAIVAWSQASVPLLAATFDSMRRLILAGHYSQLANSKAVGYLGPQFEKPEPPPIVADQPLSPPFDPDAEPPAPPAEARDAGPPSDGGDTSSAGGTR
jgi:hypothetical protein